jgi:hypothetical protein
MKEKELEEILKRGKGELRVLRGGMWQRIEFVVKEKKTPIGSYRVLFTDRQINADECVRIANEYQFPIETPIGIFFPSGKSAVDFYLK